LQLVHKSSFTGGFTTRPDLVECWFGFCSTDTFTILRNWLLGPPVHHRLHWFLHLCTEVSLILVGGACSDDTRFQLWCARCTTSGAVLTQNSGRFPVPRFCLNVNFFTIYKRFQLSSPLIIVVSLCTPGNDPNPSNTSFY